MNERIWKLTEQIVCFEQDMDGSMEPNENGQWIRVDELEKFAELIVRECCQVLEQTQTALDRHKWPTPSECGVYIKEHFGVEE